MPIIEVRCRDCKQRYQPSSDDIITGVWQRCPECRAARQKELQPLLRDDGKERDEPDQTR